MPGFITFNARNWELSDKKIGVEAGVGIVLMKIS